MMADLHKVQLAEDTPYVNAMLLQMIKGVEEVMGVNGLNAVLRLSGLERYIDNPPPNNLEFGVTAREYAGLNEAIEKFTGRAGKGMLQRIGRSSFRWGVKEQSAVMGLAGIALKVLPQQLRKRAVLLGVRKGIMDTVEYASIDVKEENGALIFTDYACVSCHLRHSDRPVCHLYVGSLQEAMTYATGKSFQEFEVVETHCIAQGDDFCRFEIRDR
ncbi:MAG: 4-vinyl reductase [Chloroflexi bacterium]|nr:4-vinyl reductase [Chloroflexota bacterium]MBP7043155.1 4-vinyl reductase [Chloroflexota bacterium]